MEQRAEQNYQGRPGGCEVRARTSERMCVCVYNCVRVLNNGIDILLSSYDQDDFFCALRADGDVCFPFDSPSQHKDEMKCSDIKAWKTKVTFLKKKKLR